MRKFIFTIALLIFLSPLPAEAVTQWCDDANAVACYSIEEGAGTTTEDLSSNSNNGTFTASGEPAWDSGNVPSSGDGFNGTSVYSTDYNDDNDAIDLGHDASIDSLTTLTVVAWVFLDTVPDQSEFDYIISQRDNTSLRWTFHTDSLGDNGKLTFNMNTNSTDVLSRDSVVMNTGSWIHVAFTYDDGGDRKGRLFIDGVEIASYETQTAGTGTIVSAVNAELTIGNRAVSLDRGWDGNIDEVGIFDDIKDSTDRNDIMDNGLVQIAAGTTTVIR